MTKRGTFIGFALGFLVAWLLFKGNDDLAWITLRNTVLNAATFFLGTFIAISPYGRLTDTTDNFAYVLHWSTGWSVLALLIYLFILFISSKKFFLVKLVLSVSFFMITWYSLYFVCFLIVMIPVFFNILSALAVSVTAVIIGSILSGISFSVEEMLDEEKSSSDS